MEKWKIIIRDTENFLVRFSHEGRCFPIQTKSAYISMYPADNIEIYLMRA